MAGQKSGGANKPSNLSLYLVVALLVVAAAAGGFLAGQILGHSGGNSSPPALETVLDRIFPVPVSTLIPTQNGSSDFTFNQSSVDWFNVSFSASANVDACGVGGYPVGFLNFFQEYQDCVNASGSVLVDDATHGVLGIRPDAFNASGLWGVEVSFGFEAATSSGVSVRYSDFANNSSGTLYTGSGVVGLAPSDLSRVAVLINATLPSGYSSVSVNLNSTVPISSVGGSVGGYVVCCWQKTANGAVWAWNGTYAGSAALALTAFVASAQPSSIRAVVEVS